VLKVCIKNATKRKCQKIHRRAIPAHEDAIASMHVYNRVSHRYVNFFCMGIKLEICIYTHALTHTHKLRERH
jgi:hypothetical protein